MGLFDMMDAVLDQGGQVMLDIGALMPFGPMVNGAQAVYHGLHSARDAGHGHLGEAASQACESMWNGINAIPGIHHMLHAVHVAEAIWDGGVLLHRWVGKPFGEIPSALQGLSQLVPKALRLPLEIEGTTEAVPA